jgi:excinuclease UvrABC nuclease subunit
LLRHFGSLREVRAASLEELQVVLGPTVGERVFEQLQQET